LAGAEPFDHKCGRDEFLHDYWCHLLDNEESDVLAVSDNQFMHARGTYDDCLCKALAVKIFSTVPISMVDERVMLVVTWLNSLRWKWQQVPMMANHLII